MIKKITLLYLVICTYYTSWAQAQTASSIAEHIFEKTKNISTLTFTMKKAERIQGKMLVQQSSVKLQLHPLKVYLRQNSPNNGLEVLYVQGSNHNQAFINPNGFPWFSISLDPYGSTMRENQHHTLLNSGYDHVISILEHLFKKYHAEIEEMVKKEADVVWDHHSCWVITLNNPHFKYYNYTVKEGENILDIAGRYKLSEHMILEKNPSLKTYNKPLSKQTIQIPNDYSSKMTLYIDKQRGIPLVMKIYDDQGLYEQYEYTNMVVNPIIQDAEFTKNYPGYNF